MERIDKIDTQGLSGPATPEQIEQAKKDSKNKPMLVRPRRLFTPEYAKEMKILINEVLDEREYQRKLRMSYDDPTPPGVSYFDTSKFEYRVGEEEPPYKS
tara:strand:+ start:1388 stop:1687 length:300 start_codon:yes stop_codon:yes gene_type:complete